MPVTSFTMRQLLEAGVHFGHRTGRWNPKMAPYVYGKRNGVHIIDLQKTVPMLHHALVAIQEIVSKGGRVLFVGTKRQAGEKVAEAASRCGQHYVNHRWLGGMMTNWKTISISMHRLKELEEQLSEENVESIGLTKKELLKLTRERNKLERALGGIKEMGGIPDILFVIDTNKESIAIHEAKKLNIPVVAVVDTNSNPDDITYPIPGNDDAVRAINLYCDLVAQAVLGGIQTEMERAGIDVGESEDVPQDILPVAKTNGESPEAAVPQTVVPEAAVEQSAITEAPAALAPEASEPKPTATPIISQVASTVVLGTTKEAAPEAIKEAVPEAVKETAPEAIKEAPPEAVKEAPPEAVKEAPPEAVKEPPPEAVKEAPPEAAKEAAAPEAEAPLLLPSAKEAVQIPAPGTAKPEDKKPVAAKKPAAKKPAVKKPAAKKPTAAKKPAAAKKPKTEAKSKEGA